VTEITSDWRDRTDHHASRASLHPSLRGAWQFAYDLDPIETSCTYCTLVYQGDTWVHDGSCPAAAAARRTRTAQADPGSRR
jgi:hypothetical protein